MRSISQPSCSPKISLSRTICTGQSPRIPCTLSSSRYVHCYLLLLLPHQSLHYRVYIFQNPRDQSIIGRFATQFSTYDVRWVVEAYKKCTTAAYTYMVFDSTQSCRDAYRIRSHIMPGEDVFPRVWIRKEEAVVAKKSRRR